MDFRKGRKSKNIIDKRGELGYYAKSRVDTAHSNVRISKAFSDAEKRNEDYDDEITKTLKQKKK